MTVTMIFCAFLQLIQVDTMVCITSSDFNFNQSEHSQKLSKKAGTDLRSACNSRETLAKGSVQAETDGFKLPCNKVLHCHLAKFDDIQDAYEVGNQCFYIWYIIDEHWFSGTILGCSKPNQQPDFAVFSSTSCSKTSAKKLLLCYILPALAHINEPKFH